MGHEQSAVWLDGSKQFLVEPLAYDACLGPDLVVFVIELTVQQHDRLRPGNRLLVLA